MTDSANQDEMVLDASVVAKWFHSENENHLEAARQLRRSFESGTLTVFVPPLLQLELLNIAGRSWRWTEEALITLAVTLESIDFQWETPELQSYAFWIAKGLTSYDACYVALATQLSIPLVTDDRKLCQVAGSVTRALSDL